MTRPEGVAESPSYTDPVGGNQRIGLALNFAFTIALSAFLLFQVQPLISKFILPWFGGSPSVWTTCMLFFQVLLFGGYAYAHASVRFLRPQAQGLVHLALLGIALFWLPMTPSDSWKPGATDDPTWRILCVLGATIGMPYLVLSSTGPLLQAWFSRAFPGRSPYRLYALSNAGSLLALLTYPFVFEPAWDSVTQSRVWSGGFVVFVAACAVAGIWSWRKGGAGQRAVTEHQHASDAEDSSGPTPLQRVLWVLLPAWASLVLLATTNHVCQDIAVIPFLCVAPLALYLLTFIICFDHERWYHRPTYAIAAAFLVLFVAAESDADAWLKMIWRSPILAEWVAIYLLAMFLVCMVCHGELVRLKPAPRHLTEFYLMISAGGALGGIFVSLVAPLIFKTLFEWQIALLGSFLLAMVVAVMSFTKNDLAMVWTAIGGVITACGLWGITQLQASTKTPLDISRNFYGVVYVLDRDADDPEAHFRTFRHGTITHGHQFRAPNKRRFATTYYSASSGVGRALEYFAEKGPMRVGAIGLGAGTVAAYGRAGDYFHFYEINPEVVRLSNKDFTYLSDCPAKPDIVLGDARLSLERELERGEPQRFDVLIVDAFSGDAIPTHLLTKEAVDLYLKHMAEGGVLAVHITNSHLDLRPVVRDLADYYHLKITEIDTESDSEQLINDCDWALMTKNEDFIRSHPPELGNDPPPPENVPLWTDHYSNLFQLLK